MSISPPVQGSQKLKIKIQICYVEARGKRQEPCLQRVLVRIKPCNEKNCGCCSDSLNEILVADSIKWEHLAPMG